MLLQHCTWPEVEARLERSTGILVPIGSTEQHGPNGLIGTDAICAEVVAVGAGEAVDALVAPTISVGMAQHHLGFAGSITLRPSTLIAVVRDTVQSLSRHGFDRFFFVNGHGGNVATVTAAFSEVYAERSLHGKGDNQRSVRCHLRNWYDGAAIKELSAELYGKAEGSHATPSEVSLTQYARPEAIKTAAMSPEIAPWGPIYDAEDYRRRFADGRIGSNPALSSPEAGKRIFDTAVTEVAESYRRFLDAA